MAIIGIDLGTTNSAVAYLKNERPEIIENANGGRTTPSAVAITPNGEILVGESAKASLISTPDRAIIEVKRLMGTDQKVQLADKEYRPEEISAIILRELKKSAEEKLGTTVTEAVITVPAYFSDAQRKATQKAGELAGLTVERIINEPTAAAIAYGLENMDKEQHIFVYDLGGGTFDVSVVEMFEGVVEVKASAGNNHLGGMDFDNAIVQWVADKVKSEQQFDLLNEGSSQDLAMRTNRMKEEAERVKKLLSSQTSARFSLPFIAVNDNAPINIDLEVTRFEFEKMIKDIVMSTIIEVDKAIQDAGLSVEQIDEVLLIGGSTRVPYIQEIVNKKFGKSPRKDINPDEAVALGAAIQAGIKSGAIDSKKGIMITDLCPYTLGTEVLQLVAGQPVPGFFDPIIPRNSTVPVKRTKNYQTASDYQEAVIIKVYQGDDKYADRNIFLGEVELTGIPKAPAGQQSIEITFTYDINGNLQVEGTIVSTGKKESAIIRGQSGVMNDQEVAASREKLDKGWEQSELYKEVQAVVYRAEKMLSDVPEPDARKIETLLNQLKQALSRNDSKAVKKYEEELTDLLIELV